MKTNQSAEARAFAQMRRRACERIEAAQNDRELSEARRRLQRLDDFRASAARCSFAEIRPNRSRARAMTRNGKTCII